MFKIPTFEYWKGRNLNYKESWRGIPNYLRVAKVIRVKKRIFPHHNQELIDYFVCYSDGTADCISMSPIQDAPVPGKFFSRVTALSNVYCANCFFSTWAPTAEELSLLE